MEKLWIKRVLIVSFIISLLFVFIYGIIALQHGPALTIAVAPPQKPVYATRPAPPVTPTPDLMKTYLEQSQLAATIDKQAVDTYALHVNAYNNEVQSRITAEKANQRDASARVTAFEKVIKDTIGPLIVTPLLAALIVFSGIKVTGDVMMARATAGSHRHVDTP